jgi:hypothetical protein
MKKLLSLSTVMLFFCQANYAQKQTTHVQQTWFAFLNQTRFSDRWGMWADFHLRTREDFFSDLSSGIARVGITWYANDHVKLTAGYAFVNHFPADNHSGVSQPEHRPWQQIQWHTNSSKLKVTQAVRLEERYRRKIANDNALADGYNFNYRIRYNLLFLVPLSKKAFAPKTVSLALNDELHVNFGKSIVYNYFDQNRLFIGLAYHVNKHDNLQFGYMNIFQQQAAGNRYRSLHVPRIFYFHSLDLRKKQTAHKK